MAETFLVKCLKSTTDLETFNDLRLDAFNNNALKMDLERIACTSTNARKHINRSYYQLQLRVQAPFRDATLPKLMVLKEEAVHWYLRLCSLNLKACQIPACVASVLARMGVLVE